MAEKKRITPEQYRCQIEAYRKSRPRYVAYADALRRVLERACRVSFPEALVQARAKALSSFAEKAARKIEKYPDAASQMTDLCGARVVVQTIQQVLAVRAFIEANFKIVEKEDKGLLLSLDEFGYRDMHYIVELRPDRCEAIGITGQERDLIADRRGEIQVRTWVQHAWADTLHDRIYKNKLKISSDLVRTGALLAALMEEGDRSFDRLATQLDGLIANYTALATKKEVEEEIAVQQLILENEPDPETKPGLALKLARLVAASGDHARVVELLEPHADLRDASRCELLLELGHSLCRMHRQAVDSSEYRRGRGHLEEAVALAGSAQTLSVPHLRKRESLHARALGRLAWVLEAVDGEQHEARNCYRQAHEHEPSNPYYLAAMVGFEMFCERQASLPDSMRTTIREAVRACREHASAGIELPYAHFTAGRLSLLLGEAERALGYYARGIRHVLAAAHCVPPGLLSGEKDWIRHIYFGVKLPAGCQRVVDLLSLAGDVAVGLAPGAVSPPVSPPVLIVAGGVAGLPISLAGAIPPLLESVKPFRGAVIDGEESQPEQVLRYWSDILASGVRPGEVMLLGLGGGERSAVEYRIALGLGAAVAVVAASGGAADDLLADECWSGLPNLYPLPSDIATIRAFLVLPDTRLDPAVQEEMAVSFHEQYVAASASRLPRNLRPWPDLEETFRQANLQQAQYSIRILEAAGFEVHPGGGTPKDFEGFTKEEIERMAELEHGRWNIERLRDGWRYGKPRDDSRKIHDCLVSWQDLPDAIKLHDRVAVAAFPSILAKAGLEVRRR